MSRAGGSAREMSEALRAKRIDRLRSRWPVVVVAAVFAFLLGFYLPDLVFRAVSSALLAVAPESGGLDMDLPRSISVVLGSVLALGALIGLLRPSRSEAAWRKGASAETRVGRVLDSLQGEGIWVLHDRRIPGSTANIDHVVVTRAGIFSIDTKSYSGRLDVRAGGTQLWINGHNRSSLLEQARRQAEVVEAVLDSNQPGIPIHAALCFVGTSVPLLTPRAVGGVLIWTSATLTGRLRRAGPMVLTADQVVSIGHVLTQRLM